jgi:hypothetical protein
MGYHRTELKGDKEKTTFSKKNGHWVYKRLPKAQSTFQRMMNSILSGLTGSHCFLFLDIIVIHVRSLSEHNVQLRGVLRRISKSDLKL